VEVDRLGGGLHDDRAVVRLLLAQEVEGHRPYRGRRAVERQIPLVEHQAAVRLVEEVVDDRVGDPGDVCVRGAGLGRLDKGARARWRSDRRAP
jgi:hypothetical protein